MRKTDGPRDSGTIEADDRPYEDEIDDAERRGEPVGAGRHVARGGPEEADVDGETTDGEYGPGSD
jgi:hypothetical protein